MLTDGLTAPDVGSPLLSNLPLTHIVTVSLACRISLIVADVMVLGATWMKAMKTVREARRLKMRVPLSEVLIRDGECFCALLFRWEY